MPLGPLEKRVEGIIRVTTTWEEEVTGLKWPEENGVKQIDPKVWTLLFHTGLENH